MEVIDLHQKSWFCLNPENDLHLMQCSDQPKMFTKCSYWAKSPIEPLHLKKCVTLIPRVGKFQKCTLLSRHTCSGLKAKGFRGLLGFLKSRKSSRFACLFQ